MRNLKKFLALALAMVMAFSLMLSASAADQVKDWTDKDEVTKEFTKAVDVLSGMEIFQGDDKGFRPGDSITRAEVAALVYRAATGDVTNARTEMYRTYAPFTDVKSDDWFAGYVGYCWNAGYIKGETATRFNPYAPVTGYEVLAMILRAVGYDKNHEFEGSQWIVNVASIANDKKVTKDVKATIYGDTLHGPARRDVVASLLFNAINLKTVTYTPALGYETDRVGASNKSLGELWFNLKKTTGIVVGNQDTGEDYTRVNSAKENMPDHVAYFHQTTNWNENDKSATKVTKTTDTTVVDAKTGIDMFGHAVEVWHNSVSHKTFALYDNVKKTALVTSTDATLSNAAGNGELGKAAVAAGFNVDLKRSKAVFNQDFGVSGSIAAIAATEAIGSSDYVSDGQFANIGSGDSANGVASKSTIGTDGSAGSYPLYLLISNSSNNQVDMVVALNALVSRVSQVNNYGSYPSVTVTQNTQATTQAAWNDKTNGMIEQKALTATSDKELNDPVVGVAIIGTNTFNTDDPCTATAGSVEASGFTPTAGSASFITGTNTDNLFYRLSKPTQYVEGTVVGYNHSLPGHSGSITVDGKEIKRSLLADAIVGYDNSQDSFIPTAGATFGTAGTKAATRGINTTGGVANLSPDTGDYGQYRVYLDSEGKYIWAEPLVNSEFIYGTYVDYQTAYGSSTYEYTMIGVNLKGEQVKKVVTSVDGEKITALEYGSTGTLAVKKLFVPYRDTDGTGAGGAGTAGVTPNSYVGFNVTEKGALTSITSSTKTVKELKGSPTVYQGTDIISADTTIKRDDAKLGMMATQVGTKYFTNSTKFIVVDGAGTDTQTVKVYNGMTELLDGAAQVKIKYDTLAADTKYLLDDNNLNLMMYYTMSPFTYASVHGNQNYQVDTIILPKAALTWTGRSNLVYNGNKAATSVSYVGTDPVYLYTMYQDGEAAQYWIDAAGYAVVNANHDKFFELKDSDKDMPDGSTIWTTTAAEAETLDGNHRPDVNGGTPSQPIITRKNYDAATYSAQTAKIGDAAGDTAGYNVSNAKVVNLNAQRSGADLVWPTISDLGSLNDASSTAAIYHATKLPKVSVLVDPTDPMTVLVIYVCYDQTT